MLNNNSDITECSDNLKKTADNKFYLANSTFIRFNATAAYCLKNENILLANFSHHNLSLEFYNISAEPAYKYCLLAQNKSGAIECVKCLNSSLTVVNGLCIKDLVENCVKYQYDTDKFQCIECAFGFGVVVDTINHCILAESVLSEIPDSDPQEIIFNSGCVNFTAGACNQFEPNYRENLVANLTASNCKGTSALS